MKRDKTRQGGLGRRLLLLGCALVVSLLAAELVLRLVGVSVGTVYISRRTVEPSEDPELRFRLRPDSSARAEVDYVINAQGMRDVPRSRTRAGGRPRLAVVGDSIPFGYWVTREDAFPSQMESLVRAASPAADVEVLNFGVPGYDLGQNLAQVRRTALAFEPDLVVLSLCLNDFEGPVSYQFGVVRRLEEQRRGGVGARAWSWLLDHSILASWWEYRRQERDLRREFAEAAVGTLRVVPADALEAAREPLREHLTALQAALEDAGGIPVLVVVFPALDQPLTNYPYQPLHDLVAETARQLGMPLLDLLPCYRHFPLEDLRVDPLHPSPMGHRVAAHRILEELRSLGLEQTAWVPENLGRWQDYQAEDFARVKGY